MYIKRIVKLSISIMLITLLFSCKNLEKEYKSTSLMNNIYLANSDFFADATAEKIVIPGLGNEFSIESIGAESYFIASTDRAKSNYTKYLNPYKRMPIASLTKLMTALVVLENCKDLNEEYYVIEDDVDLEKDVSKANLRSGDKLKVIDLLYGLLVPSGNDAAMCLANNLVDSYDNFVIMMNNEAERIGAVNTHFANPHGLDSEYHFSTAYDLFLITRELLKYDLFKKISTVGEYSANITSSDGTIRTEKWQNTNYFATGELLISDNVTLLAGKTGNTKTAGSCLVLLTKDKLKGDEYISVVLNAKSKRNSYYNTNALLKPISN